MKQLNDINEIGKYQEVRSSQIVREKITTIMVSNAEINGRTESYEAEIWLLISEYKGGVNKPSWAHTDEKKPNTFEVEITIKNNLHASAFKSLYGTDSYLFIFEHMKEALDFYMNIIDGHHILVWDNGFSLVDTGIDEKIMEEEDDMDKQSATSIVLDYLSGYTKEEIKEMVAKNFIPFVQSLTGMSEHDILIKLDSEVYSKLYNFWKHFKIKCNETDAGKNFINEFFNYIFNTYFILDEDNIIKFKDDISYDDMKESKLGKLYSNVKERHNNDEYNLEMLLNMFYYKMKEFGDIKIIKKYFVKCKSIISDVFGDITYHSDVYNHNRDEEIKYLSQEYI